MLKRILIICIFSTLARADDFQYFSRGNVGFDDVPPRRIRLSNTKPDDVTITGISSEGVRYGQMRFGSPDSVRIAVALKTQTDGSLDLFVDRNRDRAISVAEKLERQSDRNWKVPLTAIFTGDDKPIPVQRLVGFRYGRASKLLSYRTLGYLEGQIEIDGDTIAVRRQDGNANGLFSDKSDTIWLDLNRDERWNRFQEQFPFTSILAIDEKRFAISSNAIGSKLAFKLVDGTGWLTGTVKSHDPGAKITVVSAVFQGEDGTTVMLQENALTQEVPTGRYRLHTVVVGLIDGGDRRWTYIFHKNGGRVADEQGRLIRRWYDVKKGEKTQVDVLGKLTLDADVPKSASANGHLRIQPLMFTGDGLLVTTCYNGTADNISERNCSVVLEDANRRLVGSTSTSFA